MMRKIKLILLVLVVSLLWTGCSPLAQRPPTSMPSPQPSASPPAEGPKGLEVRPPFIASLQDTLAKNLALSSADITLKEYRSVEWPDACLGLAQTGEVCAQTITPGYLVIFSTPKGTVEFHTNTSGEVFRQAASSQPSDERPVVATWQRSGGIAGICRRLILYADGGYLLQDCVKEKVLKQDQLPAETLARLKEWTGKYRSFTWKTVIPPGSADMFNDELIFQGQGTQAASEQQQQEIAQYLADFSSRVEQ